jgi:hypothetical protein
VSEIEQGPGRTYTRSEVTALAGYDLTHALCQLRQKHRLSFAEMYFLLAEQLHLEAAACIRAERADDKEEG